MQDRLKEKLANRGYEVSRIYFSISYSQGDYAAFEGDIHVAEWMLAKGYDQTYPALFLAVKDYNEHASVATWGRGGSARVSFDGNIVGNTYPAGVFSALEQDAWDDLVEEQLSAAGLEDEMQSDVDAECDELYTDLRDEYEHLTSEESFIESCECNDVTFEIEECTA